MPPSDLQDLINTITALHNQLRGPVQQPGGNVAATRPRPQPVVNEKLGGTDEWDPVAGASRHVVSFKSRPPGAVVLVDNSLACNSTPCPGEVSAGRHTVNFQLKDYQPHRKSLDIKAGTSVDWTLVTTFAQVTLTSTPTGLPVSVNATLVGQTPLSARRLPPGVHAVLVSDRCFQPTGQHLSFQESDDKTLTFELKPRPSGIDVSAKDDKGNALVAAVSVDGRRVGKTLGCLGGCGFRGVDGRV